MVANMPKSSQLTITVTPAVLDEIRREIVIGLEDAKAGNLSDAEEFFAELEREPPPRT